MIKGKKKHFDNFVLLHTIKANHYDLLWVRVTRGGDIDSWYEIAYLINH